MTRPTEFNLIKYGGYSAWVWCRPDRPQILQRWMDEPMPKPKKGGSKKFDQVKFTKQVAEYLLSLLIEEQDEFVVYWFRLWMGSKVKVKNKNRK